MRATIPAMAFMAGCIALSHVSAQEATPPTKPGNRVTTIRGTNSKLEQILLQPTDSDFNQTPLTEVVAALKKQHGIEIQLDHSAMDEAGIAPDAPITFQSTGTKFKAALELMLGPAGMTFTVRAGTLVLTTPEDAEEPGELWTHPVGDLLQPPPGQRASNFEPDADSLIELITTTVEPSTWDGSGGWQGMGYFEASQALVVPQMREMQYQIEDLLNNLRTARQLAMTAAQQPDRGPELFAPLRDTGEELEQVLLQPAEIQLAALPLSQLAAQLEKRFKIDVDVCRVALEEGGIAGDMPITCDIKSGTLHHALSTMLGKLELTYTVDDNVLIITTPEDAEARLEIWTYPVPDLVLTRPDTEIPYENRDAERLQFLLTRLVARSTWGSNGGSGIGTFVYHESSQSLVISQSRDVHYQVAQLLTDLRAAQQRAAPSGRSAGLSIGPPLPGQAGDSVDMVVCVHPVSGMKNTNEDRKNMGAMCGLSWLWLESAAKTADAQAAQHLVTAIPATVAPASWSQSGGTGQIHAFGDSLIVRQTHAVHQQIADLIDALKQ